MADIANNAGKAIGLLNSEGKIVADWLRNPPVETLKALASGTGGGREAFRAAVAEAISGKSEWKEGPAIVVVGGRGIPSGQWIPVVPGVSEINLVIDPGTAEGEPLSVGLGVCLDEDWGGKTLRLYVQGPLLGANHIKDKDKDEDQVLLPDGGSVAVAVELGGKSPFRSFGFGGSYRGGEWTMGTTVVPNADPGWVLQAGGEDVFDYIKTAAWAIHVWLRWSVDNDVTKSDTPMRRVVEHLVPILRGDGLQARDAALPKWPDWKGIFNDPKLLWQWLAAYAPTSLPTTTRTEDLPPDWAPLRGLFDHMRGLFAGPATGGDEIDSYVSWIDTGFPKIGIVTDYGIGVSSSELHFDVGVRFRHEARVDGASVDIRFDAYFLRLTTTSAKLRAQWRLEMRVQAPGGVPTLCVGIKQEPDAKPVVFVENGDAATRIREALPSVPTPRLAPALGAFFGDKGVIPSTDGATSPWLKLFAGLAGAAGLTSSISPAEGASTSCRIRLGAAAAALPLWLDIDPTAGGQGMRLLLKDDSSKSPSDPPKHPFGTSSYLGMNAVSGKLFASIGVDLIPPGESCALGARLHVPGPTQDPDTKEYPAYELMFECGTGSVATTLYPKPKWEDILKGVLLPIATMAAGPVLKEKVAGSATQDVLKLLQAAKLLTAEDPPLPANLEGFGLADLVAGLVTALGSLNDQLGSIKFEVPKDNNAGTLGVTFTPPAPSSIEPVSLAAEDLKVGLVNRVVDSGKATHTLAPSIATRLTLTLQSTRDSPLIPTDWPVYVGSVALTANPSLWPLNEPLTLGYLPLSIKVHDLRIPLGVGGGENWIQKMLPGDASNPGIDLTLWLDTNGFHLDMPSAVRIPVDRQFGPLSVRALRVAGADKALSIGIDADLDLFGITIEPIGLAIGIPLESIGTPSEWTCELEGLGLSFDHDGLSMQGMFRRKGDDYAGAARINAFGYDISAIGAYGRYKDKVDAEKSYSSFFVFASLNTPLGGPPWFFVTRLAGGLGYNRKLPRTTVADIDKNPLVLVTKGDRALSFGGSEFGIAEAFPFEPGNFWLAAGVQFTSFGLITGTAVLTVLIGKGIDVRLLGDADLTGVPGAKVGFLIEAGYSSIDTPPVIFAEGRIKPGSELFGVLKIAGGFALRVWPTKGDFVLSFGGYHPNYVHPPHYPEVPRLELVRDFGIASLKGDSYFAITPREAMAGASFHVSVNAGPVEAGLDAWVDLWFSWDPFFIEADAGFSLWVSVDLGLFSFSGSLSATIHLHFPKFGGYAEFRVLGTSFRVDFGEESHPRDQYAGGLSVSDFIPKHLGIPAKQITVVGAVHKLSSPGEGQTDEDVVAPIVWTASKGAVPELSSIETRTLAASRTLKVAAEFAIDWRSRLPITTLSLPPPKGATPKGSAPTWKAFDLGLCRKHILASVLKVTVIEDVKNAALLDFGLFTPLMADLPLMLYGAQPSAGDWETIGGGGKDPRATDAAFISLTTGVRLDGRARPVPEAPVKLVLGVEADKPGEHDELAIGTTPGADSADSADSDGSADSALVASTIVSFAAVDTPPARMAGQVLQLDTPVQTSRAPDWISMGDAPLPTSAARSGPSRSLRFSGGSPAMRTAGPAMRRLTEGETRRVAAGEVWVIDDAAGRSVAAQGVFRLLRISDAGLVRADSVGTWDQTAACAADERLVLVGSSQEGAAGFNEDTTLVALGTGLWLAPGCVIRTRGQPGGLATARAGDVVNSASEFEVVLDRQLGVAVVALTVTGLTENMHTLLRVEAGGAIIGVKHSFSTLDTGATTLVYTIDAAANPCVRVSVHHSADVLRVYARSGSAEEEQIRIDAADIPTVFRIWDGQNAGGNVRMGA